MNSASDRGWLMSFGGYRVSPDVDVVVSAGLLGQTVQALRSADRQRSAGI